MGVYWATAAILVPYLLLAWFLGIWLRLHGSSLWILRGGLAFLGILAAAVFFWFFRKSKAESEAEGGPESVGDSGGDTKEVDALVQDAVRKLRASSLGRGASLGKLPLVFVLGESGAAKTHTVVNSALDPELLAGHVYQDNEILPTSTANFWYTRQAIFADVAGDVLQDNKKWPRLVKLLQPGRVSSAVQQGQQAPRAVIVCFDCASFLEERANETSTATARKIGARLQQISQLLGISFPVYVLFTKIDRISFFSEYVRNFSKDEGANVLGATLAVRPPHSIGVYAEEETRRLEKAFDELFYSLSDRRMDLLGRENEADKRPLVYEFPRELRKVRKLLVNFLVDMARPSQLQVNPFLRGFYFTGVRPIVIDDVVAASVDDYETSPEPDSGATRIFTAGHGGGRHPVAKKVVGSRKVPQWMFLSQFFNGVLLKDQVAFRTSGFSTRVSLLRRIALISVAAIGLLCGLLLFISFLENRSLENEVTEAERRVPTLSLSAGQLASLSDLQQLDRLRLAVARLADYEEDGPPWHMRWGLYVGDALYPDARRAYFQHFEEMLFTQTQGAIVGSLRALPAQPGPSDSYDKPYNELKAYLITTSNADKSTVEFLSPVLLSHWANPKDAGPDRGDLARKQFDFYSTELPKQNPFSEQNDARTVAQARTYLTQFQDIQRIYNAMVDEVSRRNPGISFNQMFKDSEGVVTSASVVRGAFTRAGFDAVQDELKQPSHILGEKWVLGDASSTQFDFATLRNQVSQYYYREFVQQWLAVLRTSRVNEFGTLEGASKRLESLTSQTSPLLELFWFISNGTDVGIPDASDPFQPVAGVVPPGEPHKLPDHYISDSNKPYIIALAKLRADADTLRNNPTSAPDLATASQDVSAADVAVTSTMGTRVDQKFGSHKEVLRLLNEPIIRFGEVLTSGPKEGLNRGGKDLCRQFGEWVKYYPVNPNPDAPELPIEMLNKNLAPKSGAVWQFADKMAPYVTRQGNIFLPIPGGAVTPTPGILLFLSRAAALTEALYPDGSATPHFSYTFKPLPSNLEGVTLAVGSEALPATDPEKTFTWTGAPEEVAFTSKGGDILQSYKGPWAIFKLAHSARWSGPILEWVEQSNGKDVMLPSGKVKSFRYQLQPGAFNPLRPGELAGLHCVAQVAR
jgi:type VI secretion system protein ImpL